MANKKPLVIYNGQVAQLQAGDTLDAPVSEVDIITGNNGEASAVTVGMPVYVSAANTLKKAKADASGTTRVIAFVKSASIAASTSGSFQSDGVLSSSDWTAVTGTTLLTAGAQYFLSASTAGQLTTTAPTTTGQYVAPVGTALNTTDLEIAIGLTVLL